MANINYKGVRTTDGRKVQLTASDSPTNTSGTSILATQLGSPNGIATLNGSALVVQNPASADTAANPNTVALRDVNGDVVVPSTPTAANGAASKTYVDTTAAQSRAWKELLLVEQQLEAGGSGGLNPAFAFALAADLTVGDTITLYNGTTAETWTAVAAAPAANEFVVGSGAATTTLNLAAAITADSAIWGAVATFALDTYFSGGNDPQIVVYRQTPSETAVDRIYGTLNAGANQADIQVLNFSVGYDYSTVDIIQSTLVTTDPTIAFNGIGRLFANLTPSETHRTVENSAAYTWDADAQLWQKTSAGQVLDGAGLAFAGNTLNVGDNNRGVQVNTDSLEIDGSEVAGVGLAQNGTNTWQLDTAPEVPIWSKYTVAATDFTAAAATEDIELFQLPARGTIHRVVIKHSTAFSGGTLSALTLSVGISGNTTKYAAAFDAFQATGGTVFGFNDLPNMEDFGGATSIRIEAVATGDTLDNVGTGAADIWVLTSQLQA